MDEIPGADLRTQYHNIKSQIDTAIARVLERGYFILGEEVAGFEAEFADFIGASDTVGLGSGTDALELALRACEIQPGDEVISVANTSGATITAIIQAGGCPVLVDVDPLRFTIDPERIESAITPLTRAIVPVHLYGCPADLAPILEIARRHDLWVIEDCAQAHGAFYGERRVGAWGDIGAFSFYPTKNLGAFGDGGAIVTSNPKLAERVRLLRQYGWEQRNISILMGTNSRLDELQAAILRAKLPYLEQWNARRQHLAGIYHERLSGAGIILPHQPEHSAHVYHQYVIRSPQRDELRAQLSQAGVHTQVLYPVPIHLQPAFQNLGCRNGDLPVTERLMQEILSLPVYPELEDEAVERISQAVVLNC
jgi:dTDP-4-amino-4,6-dideoxygalactose transaminase